MTRKVVRDMFGTVHVVLEMFHVHGDAHVIGLTKSEKVFH